MISCIAATEHRLNIDNELTESSCVAVTMTATFHVFLVSLHIHVGMATIIDKIRGYKRVFHL